MSSGPGNLFTEFLEDYYAECDEHLSAARQNLLLLETQGSEQGTASSIDDLLRSFHSLKGLSAMVGVSEVTQLAHLLEDYLRDIQTMRTSPTPAGLNAVIAGVEAMEQVVTSRRRKESVPDISPVLRMLAGVTSTDRMEIPPGDMAPPPGARYTWHFTFIPSLELAERGVNVNAVRERLNRIGSVVHAAPRLSVPGGIAFDFVVTSEVPAEEIEPLILPGMSFKASEEDAAAVSEPREPAAPPPSSSFVRVEMQKLDELMRLTGELVISRSHFDETIRALEPQLPQAEMRKLQEVNARIERQLRAFREAVMHVRMVPIRQVFERMRFVVRGLERDTQKHVRLEIHGQDTEIDKLIVDRMMDPLLHMVRNAVSHGIDKEGVIVISAKTAGEKVIIEVQDNGRGVDFERVIEKARALQIIGPNETVDSATALEIISSPGFSTREGADMTSGRGVGMAVVQSTIKELGGSLAMETAPGQGTKFTITLPLTLVILDALLVSADGFRFAVPQSGVREIIAIEKSDMKQLERNSLIPYRGGVLPVIPVSEILRYDANTDSRRAVASRRSRNHVLVIGAGAKSVGLIVDKVTGQREIVVRSLSDPHLRIPGIIGATELGDGKPVLIVDAEVLVRLGTQRKEVQT